MFSADPILKLEKLLQSISDDKPCGEPASDDQFEYVLKSCLNQATDEIKSGICDSLEKSIKDAIDDLEKAFRSRTKDLSYLRYYLLFVFWQHSFDGLRDGISFAKQLFEKHWNHFHPVDFEKRLKELQRQLPFYDGDEFALLVLNRIRLDEDGLFIASALINSEATPNNELTDFIKKKHSEDPSFYEHTINTLDEILSSTAEFDEFIRLKIGEDRLKEADRIGSGSVRNHEEAQGELENESELQELKQDFLSRTERMLNPNQVVFDSDFRSRLLKFRNLLLNNVRLQQPDFLIEVEESTEADDSQSGSSTNVGNSDGGSVNNRMTALGQLEKVAQYFELNEPHSPIPYALREIKAWGDLSYPELLHRLAENMVEDDSAFKTISRRLNFKWPESEDDSY